MSRLVALLFAAALAAPLPAVAEEAPAPAARLPAVTVVSAVRHPIVARTVVTGSVIPRERVMVGIDVDGRRIETLLVDVADRVKAGDVLARLSTDTIEIELAQNASQLARADVAIAQAEAQIAEAEAAEVEAAAALERARVLADRGVTSQDVLDQRVSAAAAARARLASAREGLALAKADKVLTETQRREIELRLSKTEIKAPTDGIVLVRNARIGAIASSAGGALFEIAKDGLVELDAEVSESILARLAPDQPVLVTSAGAPVPVEGRIRLVTPEIDPASRLGRVRVALPADSTLKPGAYARGDVEIARSEGVVLPVSAVLTEDGESTVQIVRDGKVDTVAVETGLSDAGMVEIVKGVAEGDVVVARAGTFLREGDAVDTVAAVEEPKG